MSENVDPIHPEVKKKIEKIVQQRGINSYTISTDSGSIKGDNYLGVILKVKIEGLKDDDPVRIDWILKSAPQIEVLRTVIKVESIYEREVYMYETVFPLFEMFQKERGILEPFDEIPGFVTSHMQLREEAFVMEDMKSSGYAMKNRKEPLDYNHVRLVMKVYGKLHALSYAMKDQRPEEFKKISKNCRDSFFSEMNTKKEDFQKQSEIYNKRVLDALDPVLHTRAIELYKKYSDRAFDIIPELFETAFTNPYSVIGHGDSWINNMLFKYTDPKHPNNPTKLCLLDWQLARYGSPALDLSYFILACTDKTLRDKHFDNIIQIYYYSLCAHLADLGSDPEKMLPFHALQSELKKHSLLGFHMSIMVLHLMMSEVDEIPDWQNSNSKEEMFEAIGYKTRNEKQYNERVRGVILDCVDKGYLDFLE